MKNRRVSLTVVGIIAAFAAMLALPGGAFAVTSASTFDSGDEGWQLFNTDCETGDFLPAAHTPTGGNPGGYISGTDVEDSPESCTWGAVGPASLTGDLRSNYGGTLSLDVQTSGPADWGTGYALFASDGTSIQNVASTPPPDGSAWTNYSFTLSPDDPGAAYVDADFNVTQPPTIAQYLHVLSQVSAFAVIGDLSQSSQGDTTSFDNILVSEPANPPDSDGDGVADTSDNCPSVAGPASNGGCPVADSDGDGMPNSSDNCPAVAGPASNGGCPVATNTDCADAKEALKRAKKKLRKLKEADAPARKIRKAKRRVKRAKKRVAEACGATLSAPSPLLLTAPR